ncbi:MAG: hypothetical protein ACI4KL_03185 [Lentihominibacter sp.]
MKRKICLFICVVMMASSVFIMTSCQAETEEPQQDTAAATEPEDVTDDGLYKEIINGNVMIEYPASWNAEIRDDMIYMYGGTKDTVPFFSVECMGWVGSPETFIDNQMTSFEDKYGNQMAMPPEEETQTTAGTELKGFTARYSSDDGTATITRHEYVEVIDEDTYHFVCEYVSGGYGDVHEDETTYFEFMHALESMKIKTE